MARLAEFGSALRDAFAACEGIPNLDGLSVSPLDYQDAEIIFARLAAYCGHMKDAMRKRLAGDVEAALASERCADAQYQQLPGWARW